jgi:hypothetical protein
MMFTAERFYQSEEKLSFILISLLIAKVNRTGVQLYIFSRKERLSEYEHRTLESRGEVAMRRSTSFEVR